jgi:hypothetical protein
MLPALLFLTAVVVRYLPPLAGPAQRLVMWYAARYWTLWALLIAMPLAALVTGCAALFGSSGHADGSAAPKGARRVVAVVTVAAGMILTAVVLHVLAT